MKTFSSYKDLRNSLTKRCDDLERALLVASSKSEFESEFVSKSSLPDGDGLALQLIKQARDRLASDTIEVGIFGEVKRGKSTLINALVGRRVSSMRVTPETAIPVWVERGESRTLAIFADGSSHELEDSHEAQLLASQRREDKSGPEVVRVVQYTEVPWLPEGLRLVDTPGLQDPSLIDSYESRTMAELERVSAAIFMFVSPPGPASNEVRLLQKMARSGIDKVFLVCNFYPDVWENTVERAEVLNYVKKIVIDGVLATSSEAPQNIKLYGVNARQGLSAIEKQDYGEYEKSGLDQLRNDLEEFLVSGALKSVASSVKDRLVQAENVISSTLDARELILRNPKQFDGARLELQEAVGASERVLQDIEISVLNESKELGRSISEILCSPYFAVLKNVASANSLSELKTAVGGLENLQSGATTRASTEFERSTNRILMKAEQKLLLSFGRSNSFTSVSNQVRTFETPSTDFQFGGVVSRIDWSDVASTGVLAGAGSAVVGGSLAGGAGVALLAAGPVGWLIGAAAVGIVGLVGGATAGVMGGIGKVRAEERKRISELLTQRTEEVREYAMEVGQSWGERTAQNLRSQREHFLSEKRIELERISRLLTDKAMIERALREIRQAREILSDVVG